MENMENTGQLEGIDNQPGQPQRAPAQAFGHQRKAMLSALAAASIFAAAPTAEAGGNEPHEQKHDHHVIKTGVVVGVGQHPVGGVETSYQWLPSVDESKKFHLVITPINFAAAQHQLEFDFGRSDRITSMQYFTGSMAGLTYSLNKYVEFEAEAGGGVLFIPSYRPENDQLQRDGFEIVPAVKMDMQIDILLSKTFRTYLGYSPELTLIPVPHAITEHGAEKKYHLAHYAGFGLGADF
jgi:hypothetical protein